MSITYGIIGLDFKCILERIMGFERYQENLRNLNPEQREAVLLPVDKASLILAGAGSGKTQVLTMRLCRLYYEEGIPLSRMMAVTFTKKAAMEMRERMSRMGISHAELENMYIGTFHALCARILREHWEEAGLPKNFKILDDEDSSRYLKNFAGKMEVDKDHIKKLFRYLSMWKESNVLDLPSNRSFLDGYDKENKTSMFHSVCQAYQEHLYRLDRLDFDDLMVVCYKLFKSNPQILEQYRESFDIVLVDEFQDTSEFQYEWLKLLTFEKKNLFAVGDDDQSIYSFRNANVRNIHTMFHEYSAQRVKLERNYRSAKDIIEHSNKLIRFNKSRMGKTLVAQKPEKGFVQACTFDRDSEMGEWVYKTVQGLVADGYQYSDIVCLYRSRSAIVGVCSELERYKLPFSVQNQIPFYRRTEIKDLIHYMELAAVNSNAAAFERVCNVPPRSFGDTSLQRLENWYRDNKDTDGFDSNIFAHLTEERMKEIGVSPKSRKQMADFAVKMQLCNRLLARNNRFWEAENHLKEEGKPANTNRLEHAKQQKALMEENVNDVIKTLGEEAFANNPYSKDNEIIRYHPSGGLLSTPCIHWLMWVCDLIKRDLGLLSHHLGRMEKKIIGKDGEVDKEEYDRKTEWVKNLFERFEKFLKNCFTVEDMFSQFDEWLLHTEQEEVKKNEVRLMTIHASKGLEFPVVILIGCSENLIPSRFSKSGASLEEERRLMYVGMTRAKEILYMAAAERYTGLSGQMNTSRFIRESDVNVIHYGYQKKTVADGRRGGGW